MPVRPSQLAWLEEELRAWQDEGLITDELAATLRGRYDPRQRAVLSSLVAVLGACLLGAGLIWLVAANLDQWPPLVRFLVVAGVWLGFTIAAAAVRHRAAHVSQESDGPGKRVGGGGDRDRADPEARGWRLAVSGGLDICAVAAFGAVIFQAAQSLQVPAYTWSLLGYWALGAMLYAYGARGRAALAVAVALSAGWLLAEVLTDQLSVSAAVAALGGGALIAAAVATAHRAGWWPELADPWLHASVALALTGLFVAALPFTEDQPLGTSAVTVLIVAAITATAALVLARRAVSATASQTQRGGKRPSGAAAAMRHIADRTSLPPDLVLTAAVCVVAVVLSRWQADPDAGQYARASVSVLAFLIAAVGYAVLGAARERPLITYAAGFMLVIFVTLQSFAVFARILSGATLFLVVGSVLLLAGTLAERGRRRLRARQEA